MSIGQWRGARSREGRAKENLDWVVVSARPAAAPDGEVYYHRTRPKHYHLPVRALLLLSNYDRPPSGGTNSFERAGGALQDMIGQDQSEVDSTDKSVSVRDCGS